MARYPFLLVVLVHSLGWMNISGVVSPATAQDPVQTEASGRAGFEKKVLPVLRRKCVRCHGGTDEVRGDVNLAILVDQSALVSDPELIQDLIRVIDLSEMPPEDEGELPGKIRSSLLNELRQQLELSVARQDRLGLAELRRMNRFQYNNAVKDLFELKSIVFTLPERMMREHGNYFKPASGKMPDNVKVGSRPLGKSQMIEKRLAGVAAFPQDLRAEHGFDNRGDQLSLSPLLMDAFLGLSKSILESPDFKPPNVGIWHDFFAAPEGAASIRDELSRRLRPFLTRAFRRPVSDASVNRYADYASRQIKQGNSFTDAMKQVAGAVIASPRFLYLYSTSPQADASASGGEVVADDRVASLDRSADLDLASRMSFFLWGSLPDLELIEMAETGQLRQPEVLQAQFRRMMSDHKLKRFCDSFPSQWLQLERIISSVPNRDKFPGFYMSKYRHSMHMMLEPLLLFEAVLIENLPLTQLVDSDFTYRSPLLRNAYDGSGSGGKGGGVTVLNFTRQEVTDRRQGGVITSPATMTMTSGPERTKPITRGAWVSTVIFNLPPEPPPADVPPLEEKNSAAELDLTLRERLAIHRERADCAGCHEKIDPLGFALENYDPIGKWRDTYDNGREIDVSGQLFRRHQFSDIVGFKDAILAEKDRFVRGFAGHLLSFALARELGPQDQSELDRIAAATIADDDRIQTLVREVVFSKPFLGGVVLSQQHLTTSP